MVAFESKNGLIDMETCNPFRVPFRCLVPPIVADEVVEGMCTKTVGGNTGSATISVTCDEDVPTLSDRIVTIAGAAEQQERACRELLSLLWQAQNVGEEDPGLLVILVPSAVAPAVIGTRGQTIHSLIEKSGAAIEVSREVIDGLASQPVTLDGTLEQVLRGTLGVHDVLQELAARGRLGPADFKNPVATALFKIRGGIDANGSGSSRVAHHVSVGVAPAPAVLMVGMDIAGWVIGKRGARIVKLQRESGARITLLGGGGVGGGGLPGMRCGDRLIEIRGEDALRRAEGVRSVLAAIAEAPSGQHSAIALLIPEGAVGYIIGRGGQNIKDLMSRFDVHLDFNQDAMKIAGGRPVGISGTAASRAEAVLALVSKVDELRARLASGNSNSIGFASDTCASSAVGVGVGHQNAAPAAGAAIASPCLGVGTGSYSGQGACMASQGPSAPMATAGVGAGELRKLPLSDREVADTASIAEWPARTAAERALLAGIQASGVLSHQLTMRVPRDVLLWLDSEDLEHTTGARLEVCIPDGGADDTEYCYVTLTGQRMSTSMAVLYIQEFLSQHAAGEL